MALWHGFCLRTFGSLCPVSGHAKTMPTLRAGQRLTSYIASSRSNAAERHYSLWWRVFAQGGFTPAGAGIRGPERVRPLTPAPSIRGKTKGQGRGFQGWHGSSTIRPFTKRVYRRFAICNPQLQSGSIVRSFQKWRLFQFAALPGLWVFPCPPQ